MTKLPFLTLPLINDGDSCGTLTVPSTEGMAKGATIFISANGIENKQLVVDDVVSATTITVKDPSGLNSTRFDCSRYKVSLQPKITQPEQHSLYAPFTKPSESIVDFRNYHSLLNTVGFLSSKIEILENKLTNVEQQLAIKKLGWFKRFINWIMRK